MGLEKWTQAKRWSVKNTCQVMTRFSESCLTPATVGNWREPHLMRACGFCYLFAFMLSVVELKYTTVPSNSSEGVFCSRSYNSKSSCKANHRFLFTRSNEVHIFHHTKDLQDRAVCMLQFLSKCFCCINLKSQETRGWWEKAAVI